MLIGRLIPAGTGMDCYRSIEVDRTAPVHLPILDEVITEADREGAKSVILGTDDDLDDERDDEFDDLGYDDLDDEDDDEGDFADDGEDEDEEALDEELDAEAEAYAEEESKKDED